MLTEDKVTELFFIADEFCKYFDWMMARYTLKNAGKRPYHRETTLSKAEIMLIIILFHDSGYRCFKQKDVRYKLRIQKSYILMSNLGLRSGNKPIKYVFTNLSSILSTIVPNV
jgi:hypothetical protein